jgi:hypothetical protein
MNELVAADGDGDVRRPRRADREKQKIARFDVVRVDGSALGELIADRAREGKPVLPEDVLCKAAAVEAPQVGAPVAIVHTAQLERRPDERIRVDEARRLTLNGR